MIDMYENMNDGKSYEYFDSLSKMYPDTVPRDQRPWDYAMKVDDDSFLHIPKLLEKMRSLPRTGCWFVLPPSAIILTAGTGEQESLLHVRSRIHSILGHCKLARKQPQQSEKIHERLGGQTDLRDD